MHEDIDYKYIIKREIPLLFLDAVDVGWSLITLDPLLGIFSNGKVFTQMLK